MLGPGTGLIVVEADRDGTGFELCDAIRNMPQLKDIPVIMTVAQPTPVVLDAVYAAGAVDYVVPPFHASEVLARVGLGLRLHQERHSRTEHEDRLRYELALARRLQRSVLSEPICRPDIHIDSAYIPSAELSGDMYYWSEIDEHRYGILLVDVMGHGLRSSLISMAMRSLMPGLIDRVIEPAAVLQELNKHMYRFQPYYLTAISVLVDTQARRITYANAGHPPGLVVTEAGEVARLGRTAMPIGLAADLRVDQVSVPYRAGTRLILYTDGLCEQGGNSIRKGIDQLAETVVRHHELSVGPFICAVLRDHEKLLAAQDDICLISACL